MSDRMSEDLSERMSDRMSEDLSERMSEDLSERVSDRMSEDLSERMSGSCQAFDLASGGMLPCLIPVYSYMFDRWNPDMIWHVYVLPGD